MKGLTEKQRQIYQFIVSFQQDHGYPPSVREIGEYVGLKSPSTVHFHLKGLEEAGIITKAEGKTRAITVAGGFPAPERLALVLLAAGLTYTLGKLNRDREKLLRKLLKLKPAA